MGETNLVAGIRDPVICGDGVRTRDSTYAANGIEATLSAVSSDKPQGK